MAMIVPFVGAAIGGAVGGTFLGVAAASWGYMIGSLVATMLQPGQKVQGPRLGDLQVTGSAYGAPIPHVIGRTRIGGQVVWASQKREIPMVTESGKGGGGVTSTNYTYEVDLLIKLSSNRLEAIRKIFYNNNLVWTASSESNFSSINASGEFATSVQFFDGDANQMPWSVYEAAVGAGNAPAFRGSACLGVQGLQLGNSGQIGVITLEVLELATEVIKTLELESVPRPVIQNVVAFSDEHRSTMVWPREITSGADYFEYIVNGYQGETFERSSVQLSGFEYTMVGRSDRPIAICGGLGQIIFNFLDGSNTVYLTCPGAGQKFCLQGNTLIVVTSTNTIHRYDISLSTEPVASGSLGYTPRSLVINDDVLYISQAAGGAPHTVHVLDIEMLTEVRTFLTPAGNGAADLLTDDAGNLMFLTDAVLYRSGDLGATWGVVISPIPAGYGALVSSGGNISANPYFFDGQLVTSRAIESFPQNVQRVVWRALDAVEIPLDDAIIRLLARSGVDAADVDLTALDGKTISGMAIVPSATRQPLEMMASVFMFEWCGLKAVLRGGAPAATIAWAELGAAMDGDDPPEALPLKKRNDVEIPAYIHVKYINGENDYQDGLESSDRLATDSYSVQVVEVPIVLSPTQAKRLANMLAADLQASMITVGPVTIQRDWEKLEPCDVVLFTDKDGSQMRTRVSKLMSGNGLITLDGPFDDAGVIDATSVTDTDYESSTQIVVPPQSRALMVDTVPLRDADATTPGAYVAIDAFRLPFPGASLFMGQDETSMELRGQVTAEAPIGRVEGVLGNWTLNVEDDVNAFVIDMGDSPMFNVSRDDMFNNNANPWAIGQSGRWEIGQSMDFTDLGSGRWLVRSHLRGRRATEHNCGNHAAGDYFVFLNPPGMLRPAMDFSELNQPRVLRSVTAGRSIQSAQVSNAVNTGEILKPRSAVNLRSVRASDGAITATWDRRSRLSQILTTGVIPLDEPSEKYQMVIYTSNTYATERRVIEVNAATAIYTAAMQTADGVTPGAVAYARVFQMSDRVGRGVPLTGIL